MAQTQNEGSMFIQVRVFFFVFFRIILKRLSVMVGMSTVMEEASYSVMSNTLKPRTQTHRLFVLEPHFIYKSIQISNVFMMKYTGFFFSVRLRFFFRWGHAYLFIYCTSCFPNHFTALMIDTQCTCSHMQPVLRPENVLFILKSRSFNVR